jgi:hypothetical protein
VTEGVTAIGVVAAGVVYWACAIGITHDAEPVILVAHTLSLGTYVLFNY